MSLLRQRVWRFAQAAVLAYKERGLFAGSRYIARTINRKLFLALGHQTSGMDIADTRSSLAAQRAAAPPGTVHVALLVSGGIGDQIVIARFMRDLVANCGAVQFRVFAARPAISAWAFQGVPGFTGAQYDNLFFHVMADYDAALHASTFILAYAALLRWEAIRSNPRLTALLHALMRNRSEFEAYVDPHPYRDNELVNGLIARGQNRRSYLHYLAELPYGGDALDVPMAPTALEKFGLFPGQYVTVHNGFDTDFIVTGSRATKCYPHFGAVVAQLRAARPGLQFVQVGTVTSTPIAECDVNALHKTSLEEVAGLLAGAALHLDNEGGLVHVAASLGTQSVVLFGPTPVAYFGYPQNVNMAPPVCGDCWWRTRSWMDKCAEGYDEPRCLTEQLPETVARFALAELNPALRTAAE